jgi:hypothetical protein
MPRKTYFFYSQIARRVGLIPIPSHLQGLANVEEVVAATEQSEEREVEEAGRKSLLLQLQMIFEFDEEPECIFLSVELVFPIDLYTSPEY